MRKKNSGSFDDHSENSISVTKPRLSGSGSEKPSPDSRVCAGSRPVNILSTYLQERFGCKVYKLSLSAQVTCPNRDGTCGTQGCIFCSQGGSGEFASDAGKPIPEQLEEAKQRVAGKMRGGKYIAYFQSFTSTYAPVPYLRRIFFEAVAPDDIVVLSIGTRPDCLSPNVLDLLSELNRIKPVWVELGLQTIHPATAEYIRRGYPLHVYDEAVRNLKARGIEVITHVILGLPGETEEDMLQTVRHTVRAGTDGIKLQLLHVLRGTDLETDYRQGKVRILSLEEYISLLEKIVPEIPDSVVIHRLTGDGPKNLLVAPLWSADKKRVLQMIRSRVLRLE